MKTINKIVMIVIILAIILVISTVVYVKIFSAEKVRIGYLQSDLHQLSFFVAVEKGFFQREGISFDYIAYENGVKVMEAFKAGAIDIGYLGIAPASLKTIKEDVNITIIAGANAEGSAVIVGKESNINSVSDLAGKKVAIPNFGTVQDILLRIALQKNGLNYQDLMDNTPIVTSVSQMPTLLNNREIDAYIAWEPFCSQAIADGYGRALVGGTSHEIWEGHPCCILAVRNDFLEKNNDLVKKLVKIHVDATRWIIENREEAIMVAKKWTNLSEEILNLAMENIIFLYKPNVEGVKQYIHYLLSFNLINEGEIEEGIDTFIERFVNTKIVEEVE